MKKILFVAPTQGNGGIASWTANYRKVCPEEYKLISVGVSKRRSLNNTAGIFRRMFDGILDMFEVFYNVRQTLKKNHDINIMHLTISGKPGIVRDYFIVKSANKNNVKTIVHCHFGSVWNQVSDTGFWGKLLRSTFQMADQVWVLDKKSYDAINSINYLKGKAFINPNFIDVPSVASFKPKRYLNIAFIGNLFPTKGIYDLVSAVASLHNNTILHIIGPGQPAVIDEIEKLARDKLGKNILLYGRLPNDEVLKKIEQIDIIALPTYYDCEAFPISILEAMSRAKLVISCDRGAIVDILTAIDGSNCGLIVKAQSPDDIAEKIVWCQQNRSEADLLCKKAYEKVYNMYRTEKVLGIYKDCYNRLAYEGD